MPETLVRHPIKVVARRTGLSPHVIRVWEKRYGTVVPLRSDGNQRLYSDDDVHRLTLLKHATDAGHSIGNITQLPIPQLHELLSQSSRPAGADRAQTPVPPSQAVLDGNQLIDSAYAAVARLDAAGLEQILEEGAVSMGQGALLTRVIAPLVQRIGLSWRQGSLKIAHEHLASAVIRTFLGNVARPIAVHASAPVLLATTPAGQLHEIGAALAAAVAANQGWRVVYLGASLPAEEIAGAARQNNARVVALSIVHPADDPQLPEELARLRRLLPAATQVVVGGRAVDAYREGLTAIKATLCNSLEELTSALELIRMGTR